MLLIATSTGQPVSTSSGSRRVASSECRLFLPKSWPGSIRIASRRTPRDAARSARPDHGRPGCRRRRRRTRPDAGGYAAGRDRHAYTPARRRTRRQPPPAAGSVPPQASFSRSAPSAATARPTCRPPRVDGDHHVRVPIAYAGDESGYPPQLLGGVDLDPRRSFDAADVEDLGALVDGAVRRFQGLALAEGRAAVEERVGGAVDDGHHGDVACGPNVRVPRCKSTSALSQMSDWSAMALVVAISARSAAVLVLPLAVLLVRCRQAYRRHVSRRCRMRPPVAARAGDARGSARGAAPGRPSAATGWLTSTS